ncbi:hypothetical protein CK203_078260 [Vitis vinifera]|nr:hypothetical protein CK203_078260 [Vitis vinifera]
MGKLSIEEMRDFSHFSHEHPLELTNLWPQGHTVCSGCKMSIVAGKDYYTCKPCSYYLHSTCYNLPRLIQHPADPNHDLNLVPSASFDCKACGLRGSETHRFHPHALKLEFAPPYSNSKGFRCDICGNLGSDHWLYRCSGCDCDTHLACATANLNPQFMPREINLSQNRSDELNEAVVIEMGVPQGNQGSGSSTQEGVDVDGAPSAKEALGPRKTVLVITAGLFVGAAGFIAGGLTHAICQQAVVGQDIFQGFWGDRAAGSIAGGLAHGMCQQVVAGQDIIQGFLGDLDSEEPGSQDLTSSH